MSASDFEGHKRSVINKRLEKLKNLDEEFARFWKHISSNYLDFRRHETDVELLRSLSQQDMVDFFAHYIDPHSPHRAKLSVHLLAQGGIKAAKGGMSQEEQTEKLKHVLGSFFTTQSVDVNYDTLGRRVSGLDLSAVTRTTMDDLMTKYLSEDAKMAEDKIAPILEQATQLLNTVLPGLGIELLPDSVEDGELAPAPEVKETTFITDVPAFKAQLQLSAAPTPIVDLSTFEDLEPKL